jgi:hypothetical protein
MALTAFLSLHISNHPSNRIQSVTMAHRIQIVIVGEVERNKLMDRYVGQSKAVADLSLTNNSHKMKLRETKQKLRMLEGKYDKMFGECKQIITRCKITIERQLNCGED